MSGEGESPSLVEKIRRLVIGGARDLEDKRIFHHLSLIAFFAWVGLGADGISSSCYGPPEAFLALGQYKNLAIFVAIATAVTVFVISTSYSQIIELFPSGGGGYLVASKLLAPGFGMVAGCALLVDYVLTITLSVASGADAIFSFLPPDMLPFKLWVAVIGVFILILLNLRGVKESVVPLVPIFLTFIITHAFAIIYSVFFHASDIPEVARQTVAQAGELSSSIGIVGMMLLLLRAYSMGAGTFTGIEAVSNGLPILRDPKVKTGKRTMIYMASSLSFMVVGLMFAYLLYDVNFESGKTLNAVLFNKITSSWSAGSYVFVLVTLFSEAAILFVAAQTGFLGGPRVLANMAMDRWFPTKFAMLSDRFVTQNGVLIMGISALILMVLTNGNVSYLVVLYSINVFITFVLSQLGMVRHWWLSRDKAGWFRKLSINGIGFALSTAILISVVTAKFYEGGWITLFVTGALVLIVTGVRRHYKNTSKMLKRLDTLVSTATLDAGTQEMLPESSVDFDPKAGTAVLLVNGFNGLGLHTLFGIIRLFKGLFKNFVFLQVGVVDAGVFKGAEDVEFLKTDVKNDLNKYINYMRHHGFYAEGHSSIGTDVVGEVAELAPKIIERFPNAVFFGGQIVFPEERFFSKWLHNYVVFAVQRRFYHRGIPFVILPIRV